VAVNPEASPVTPSSKLKPPLPEELEAVAESIRPIGEIAGCLGLGEDDLEPYGRYMAKVHLDVADRLADRPDAKFIAVTAITPTPLGEGKTVTTIGLAQGLAHIGCEVIACIRQPSLGPTFGIKGGAAGGGRAKVVPIEGINLHLTGDMHAVSIAHNLLAAAIDAHIHHGNRLGIDPARVSWPRTVDVNDRALREVVIGLGGRTNGQPRETGFVITAASEVMAVLALATDLADLRRRLGRIIVAATRKGEPITAEDLDIAGAMAALLRDALMPTLMQTGEGAPIFVHTGPFANIAHGNSSVVADRIASKLADYVVTESGFGADCGMEKLFNIKCRVSGLVPDCVVVVATVRALKVHGIVGHVVPGKPLPSELQIEDLDALAEGSANLRYHVQLARSFGVPVVVAINRFPTDTAAEIALVVREAEAAGAEAAVVSEVFTKGGEGAAELAGAVTAACQEPSQFECLYPLEAPIREKIHSIVTRVYNAEEAEYSPLAERQIRRCTKLGYDRLPVCMAKTQYSISHDRDWKGVPSYYNMPIREVHVSAGAGFLYALCGDILTMPGLPRRPAYEGVDLDAADRIRGLF
jgi:formate--tetrahydrofolate ligase